MDKLVGLTRCPPTRCQWTSRLALFSGAAANAGNRAAIIDFTTGSKLTATFINHVVRHSLENSTRRVRRVPAGLAKTDFSGKVSRIPVRRSR